MRVVFVTHPEVIIDPAIPVPDWKLSPIGRERMRVFCHRPDVASIAHVYASDERKALDCAEIIRETHGLDFTITPSLGENDRSSTGYVAPPQFWAIVDRFFAEPSTSILGWERAADAQERIRGAVKDCILAHRNVGDGDICIISHGGVGTLLLCDLLGEPISRRHAQPIAGGGCFFVFDGHTGTLEHRWRDIVP